MFWIGLIIGIAIGAGGYYLYDRFLQKPVTEIAADLKKPTD